MLIFKYFAQKTSMKLRERFKHRSADFQSSFDESGETENTNEHDRSRLIKYLQTFLLSKAQLPSRL